MSQFNAQFGEDRLLADIFRECSSGTCIEVGANDGVTGSATKYFEDRGWNCVLIEPNPRMAQLCRRNRPCAQVVETAIVAPGSPSTVSFQVAELDPQLSSLRIDPNKMRVVPEKRVSEIVVPAQTLDSVLVATGISSIDFITVDVEGFELGVLQGFSLLSTLRPKIIILERNGHFPDPRIMRIMHRSGYALRNRTGVNDWFFDVGTLGIRDKFIEYARYYVPQLPTAWKPVVRGVLLRIGALR